MSCRFAFPEFVRSSHLELSVRLSVVFRSYLTFFPWLCLSYAPIGVIQILNQVDENERFFSLGPELH